MEKKRMLSKIYFTLSPYSNFFFQIYSIVSDVQQASLVLHVSQMSSVSTEYKDSKKNKNFYDNWKGTAETKNIPKLVTIPLFNYKHRQ